MSSKTRTTSAASEILRRRLLAGQPDRETEIARERINADVAQMIYDLRKGAKLTQKQLAELVGTRTSVISRLEDADYVGHSLTMLQRIATALGQRLELRFVPHEIGASGERPAEAELQRA